MSRKQKIIVSITGIFIVLLALVGLTYAYFLTRITGNTNPTSISVTTSLLELIYNDGSDGILTGVNIEPDNNTIIDTKTFTVSSGESTESINYGVFIEELTYDFVYPTMVYSLSCKNQNNEPCNGKTDEAFPTSNDILVQNTINSSETHTYTISLKYLDNGLNQSADMNKSFSAKIQIYDTDNTIDIAGVVTNATIGDYVQINSEQKTSQINSKGEYKLVGVKPDEHKLTIRNTTQQETPVSLINLDINKSDTESVNGATINFINTSRTTIINITKNNNEISGTPETELEKYVPFKNKTIEYALMNDNRITKNETTLEFKGVEINEVGMYNKQDDYGTSWYFRGAQSYNYVNFAGFMWRIVRINGDGTIRLILDGTLDKICAEYEKDTNGKCIKNSGTTSAFNSSYKDNAFVGYMYGFTGGQINKCLTKNATTKKYTVDSSSTYTTKETCEDAGGRWAGTAYETTHINKNNSTIKTKIDKFYETYIENGTKNIHFEQYLADTIFCGDKSLADSSIGSNNMVTGYGTGSANKTYYAATKRLYHSSGTTDIRIANPTLKCAEGETNAYSRYTVEEQNRNNIKTNGDLKHPIALLSADELVMAGAWGNIHSGRNTSYYLYDAIKTGSLNEYCWTMTPYYYGGSSGNIFFNYVTNISLNAYSNYGSAGVRPVINLRSDVLIESGDGTSGNGAYTVKLPTE